MLYKTTTTCRSESNRESLHQTQCGPPEPNHSHPGFDTTSSQSEQVGSTNFNQNKVG